MCGIAGYFGQGDQTVLEKMTNSLHHRGPDDVGFFIEGQAGLGHRRLSIIDLSPAGHQPMLDIQRGNAIVFNGEIYNFAELRRHLEKKGYQFKSDSDTEVILYLYSESGVDCFAEMNGMFAIAIYDKERDQLVLSRDRLGKKPLYWAISGQTLIFGSEIKALLFHPLVKKEIDPRSLNKYLAFDFIPTPHTVYKGIYKLEPGHYLVFKNGEARKTLFWDIRFEADEQALELNRRGSFAEILKAMDQRLNDAVASRLVADVPLGIFLSGGLDSSTIAYYAQKNSRETIKTFCIGFAEDSFDERQYARQAAAFLGTDHHEETLTAQDALRLIPELPSFMDEPLADYSIIPTYLLSRFARTHVTVALGGDGGDELFFGYPTLIAERLANCVSYFPRLARQLLRALEPLIPVSHKNFSLRFKIERFLDGIASPPLYRHQAWLGTFNSEQRKKLLKGEVWEAAGQASVYDDLDNYYRYIHSEPRWNQLIYLYLRTYLMDQVLVKVDRASMAASLEVRSPFLDYRFVDFINAVDYTHKVHGFQMKYLLKQLMMDKLPKAIIGRKKQGFGVPLAAWFARELKTWLQDMLSPERVRQGGFFDPAYVQAILREHLEMKRDNRKKIWSLLVWQMWQQKWL